MKSILFVGTTEMVIAMATVASLGIGLTSAQIADNATMGNMAGGNMTGGNTTGTEETGSISGIDDKGQEGGSNNPVSPEEEEPSRYE